jgi:hypothetical protein
MIGRRRQSDVPIQLQAIFASRRYADTEARIFAISDLRNAEANLRREPFHAARQLDPKSVKRAVSNLRKRSQKNSNAIDLRVHDDSQGRASKRGPKPANDSVKVPVPVAREDVEAY